MARSKGGDCIDREWTSPLLLCVDEFLTAGSRGGPAPLALFRGGLEGEGYGQQATSLRTCSEAFCLRDCGAVRRMAQELSKHFLSGMKAEGRLAHGGRAALVMCHSMWAAALAMDGATGDGIGQGGKEGLLVEALQKVDCAFKFGAPIQLARTFTALLG